jgi:ketosteroid isomerase-like protein
VFRGRAGLKRWIAVTQEIWDEWRLMAERFLVAGDQVVVLVRVVAQGHTSGVRLDRETAHIWDIADSRVKRCEVFLDRSEALRKVDAGS